MKFLNLKQKWNRQNGTEMKFLGLKQKWNCQNRNRSALDKMGPKLNSWL